MNIYDPRRKSDVLKEVQRNRLVFISSRYDLLEMQSAEYNGTGKCPYSVGGTDVYAESVSIAVPQNWPYISMINNELVFCCSVQ